MRVVVCLFLALPLVAFGQSAIEYYNKANAQAQYQNYEEAIRLLTRAIAIKPDFADAYSLRGDCQYFIKAYDKAIADYLQDDRLKKARSSYNLACTYALKGDVNAAFQALENNLKSEYKLRMSHVQQDPDLATLRADARWSSIAAGSWYSPLEQAIFEADEKLAANDLAGAIAAGNKAIAIEPKSAKAYGNRAILHLRNGDLAKCLEDLNRAIQNDPKSVYYGNRGYTNNKLGNSAAALSDYEKAVELDPTNLVYYDLALTRLVNGDKPGALESITKHMDYFTKDEMGYYLGGVIASQAEHLEEALGYFDRAIQINNTIPQFYMKKADAEFLLKRYEDAVANYSKVIELDSNNGEAYYIRGNAKASMMNKAGACEDWRKAEALGFADANGYIRDLCK